MLWSLLGGTSRFGTIKARKQARWMLYNESALPMLLVSLLVALPELYSAVIAPLLSRV